MDALVVDAAADGRVAEALPVVGRHPHEDPLRLDLRYIYWGLGSKYLELSYPTDREGDVDRVRGEELLDGRDGLGLGAPRVELGADLGGELPRGRHSVVS